MIQVPIVLQDNITANGLQPAVTVKALLFDSNVTTRLIPAVGKGRSVMTYKRKRGVRSPNKAAQHSHGTRANQQRRARAMLAKNTTNKNRMTMANHGYAINPDTGRAAKYKELATSSAEKLWQNSNAK